MSRTKEKLLFIILLLLASAYSQNSICYSNCRQGYCQSTNPQSCTSCDLGQVNLNGKCIAGSSLPYPITSLTVNDNNTGLVDHSSIQFKQFSCTISSTQIFNQRVLGSIIYEDVPGTTYTKTFNIQQRHQYIQFKFNAAIVQSTTVILQYDLLNSAGVTIFSSRQANSPPNDTTLSIGCINNSITVQNVFFIQQAISSSQNTVILQVRSLDSNARFGISNIQMYYGSCNQKCKTCTGPTQFECLTCQGFYMTLRNGTCQTCPIGMYDTGRQCLICPANCESCQFDNLTKNVFCTSCLTQGRLSSGSCISIYSYYPLPSTLIYESADGWNSSQVTFAPLTRCGKYSLIGGISIGRQGSLLTKTFTDLFVHDSIDIYFTFFSIDQQLDQQSLYQILVDGVVVTQANFNITAGQGTWTLSNQCGQSRPELSFRVQRRGITHRRRNCTISIRSFKNWFGIRDFNLVVNNKTSIPGCYEVDSQGNCISCLNGYRLGFLANNQSTTTPTANQTTNSTSNSSNSSTSSNQSITVIVTPFSQPQSSICTSCPDSYYLIVNRKTNIKQCELCPIECKTCKYDTTQIQCTSCVAPLELINGQCKDKGNSIYRRQIIPDNVGIQTNQWILYPKLPQKGLEVCGTKTILGSSTIKYKFLSMKRVWNNLPSHRGIKLYFQFYQIDSYQNNSVIFKLNGQQYPYVPRTQRKNICGDQQILDSVSKIQLPSEGLTVDHTSNFLEFQIVVNGKIKLGINNIILFLLNCNGCNNQVGFKLETITEYSLSTPPEKGVETKLIFDEKIYNNTPLSDAFQFSLKNTQSSTARRLLQDNNYKGLIQYNQAIPITWEQLIQGKQYRAFLSLDQDYNQNKIVANPVGYLSLLGKSGDASSPSKTISSMPIQKQLPRYINIDENNIDNRKNIRNLRNLFQGCAIVALWIGLASFIFGFSSAFDDFFILCQVIFVHIFIQLAYSPPSFRLPLEGMKIVQFMAWLPWQARVQIQKGIIASDLYQRSPIQYERYYKDIVFARTIYHTILFLVIMAIIFLLLKIFSHIVSNSQNKKKYVDNYIVKYYNDNQAQKFAFIDKVMRFAYFTVVWACTLQFIYFQNTPKPFNIWNSVLCIFMFVIFVLYPIIGFIYLRHTSSFVSQATFDKNYAEVRVDSQRLFHFIWRYYKLLLIALLIGLIYDGNPLAILIPLIIMHIVDGILILSLKPFGVVQQQLLNVCFHNHYPRAYHITSAVQSFLFAILQLFILISYAVRDTASNSSYLGLGYTCCAFVVLLLINGVVRMVWGFIKIIQECISKSKAMGLNVQNKVIKQQDNNQEMVPIKSAKDLQTNINSIQNRSRMNSSRRPSYVSKIN